MPRKFITFRNCLMATLFAVALGGTALWAYAASEHGNAKEAKALLQKAVAAIKVDKSGALAKFNSGEDGFKDRDLYVFCVGPDWIATAGPTKGKNVKDLKDKKGKPMTKMMVEQAKEGKFKTISYLWPRPGATEPSKKTSYFTKVDDQVCGVGYYK